MIAQFGECIGFVNLLRSTLRAIYRLIALDRLAQNVTLTVNSTIRFWGQTGFDLLYRLDKDVY